MMRVQKNLTCVLLAFPLLLALSLTLAVLLPHCQLPCGEALMARNQGWPATHEEVSLASEHVGEPGSKSFPVKPWDQCSPVRDPKPEDPAKWHLDSQPNTLWSSMLSFSAAKVWGNFLCSNRQLIHHMISKSLPLCLISSYRKDPYLLFLDGLFSWFHLKKLSMLLNWTLYLLSPTPVISSWCLYFSKAFCFPLFFVPFPQSQMKGTTNVTPAIWI